METPNMNEGSNEGVTVTLQAIEDEIVAENYFTAAEGVLGNSVNENSAVIVHPQLELLTFCVLTLRNGFTVTGQSACADPRKFNREIGQKVARGDAIRQVWPLMGYVLRDTLYKLEDQTENLGEALTRMTAHRLGNPEAFRVEDAEAILAHFTTSHTDNGDEELDKG